MKLVLLLILQTINNMQTINTKFDRKRNNSGISLIEIMIVIVVFTILGVLTTNAVFLTLRGTQKSQSIQKVREKMNYVVSIIQRQLRGAQKITECPNSDPLRLDFTNEEGSESYFSCLEGETGYIASGSARLTSDDISITSCSFTCEEGDSGGPDVISVNIIAEDAEESGIIKGKATFDSKIILRNF
jgi:hypothetical protein